MLFKLLPHPFGRVDEVGEAGRTLPRLVVLRKDQRQDRREFCGSGIVAQMIIPNAHHVGEQAKADERVFCILMLKEDVKEGGMAVDLRREEEIARGGGEFRVDETAARQAQRGPVDAASELARQVPLKKRAGVVGIRKGRLDELVMRLVDRTVWHEGKESAKSKKWKAENRSDKTPIEVQDSGRASSRI